MAINNRLNSHILSSLLMSQLVIGTATAGEFAPLADQAGNTYEVQQTPFIKVGWGLNGTGTFINTRGLLLTALHNVSNCLRSSSIRRVDGDLINIGLFETIEIPGTRNPNDNGQPYIAHKVDKEILKLHGATCYFNRGNLEAEVISVGAYGLLPAHNKWELQKNHPDIHEEYRQKGFVGEGDIGDFALLRVKKRTVVKKKSQAHPQIVLPSVCVPFSGEPLDVGMKVWNLSFPYYSRPSSYSEYSTKVTGGKIYSRQNNPAFSESQLQVFDERTMYSSIDVDTGSSGSAILDESGSVRGLVHLKVAQLQRYYPGAAAIIPSSFMLEHFQKELGNEFVQKEILNGCNLVRKEVLSVVELIQLAPTE